MSKNEMENIVKDYIKQVKEKLPEWLKNKKDEFKETINEIEEHIWDKAEELGGEFGATEDSIRMAIAHMGTPQSIAREYKRRGTPKVYITEELWPIYTKVLGILITVVVAVNIISFILGLIFSGSFSLNVGGIFLGMAGVFTVVTLVFIGLSMEGYFPEDFKSEAELKQERKQLEKAQIKGWPISSKTGKPMKPFMSSAGMIVGGIVQMAIGLVLMMMPFPDITALMNKQFLLVIQLSGLFTVFEGMIDMIRGIIGSSEITTQQILSIVKVAVSLATIWLILILRENPEIITIVYWSEDTGFALLEIPDFVFGILSGVFTLIIVIIVISAVVDTIQAVRLERYKHALTETN